MQRLRGKVWAWWLLLLLGRLLVPEAAVLSLHAHHHTEHPTAARVAARPLAAHRAELSAQHQHCHAESLYDVAFQPALPPAVPVPARQLIYPAYQVAVDLCPARHLLPGAALRGPPVA